MDMYPNGKECVVLDKIGRAVSVFGIEKRQRFIRAVRRLFLLVIIFAAALAFVNSSFADEHGLGAEDIKGFLGWGESEGVIPSCTEETERAAETENNTLESSAESDEVSNSECESGAETESTTAITELDLSESDKGSLYFINYTNKKPDVEGILAESFSGSRAYYTEEPVVMIVHSQTTQAYIDAIDEQGAILEGVVSVGEIVCYELNRCGIATVHCTVIHDREGDSYKNTSETIKTMLEVYPSVKYVLDIQRMNIAHEGGNAVKTLVSENGAAQLRLTVSAKDARWRDSFSLALHIREELNSSGGTCMPVVLTDVEYSSGLSDYYLKIDAGAFGNTSSEAREAAKYFAKAFADTVKK